MPFASHSVRHAADHALRRSAVCPRGHLPRFATLPPRGAASAAEARCADDDHTERQAQPCASAWLKARYGEHVKGCWLGSTRPTQKLRLRDPRIFIRLTDSAAVAADSSLGRPPGPAFLRPRLSGPRCAVAWAGRRERPLQPGSGDRPGRSQSVPPGGTDCEHRSIAHLIKPGHSCSGVG